MANPRIDVEIGAKISQFQKAIADSQSSLNRFGKSATEFGKVLSLSVTAPILALGAASIKTFGQIEALQKGLIAVSKDADSASKEFTKLIQVAKLPGLGLEEAVRGSVALQSAGFSADEARESLLAFGNALATVGKGKAELNFVILALTQLQNKSTGFGQDLRQLVEQLPQLRQALTDAFGTSESEEIAKLGVTGREVVQSLVTEFQKLPQVSGGIKNAFENVSDSIQISFSVIGESINRIVGAEGLIDGLGEKIRNLANGFANLNPTTQKAILFTAGLAAAIGPLSLAIGGIISALPILTAGFAVLTGPIGLTVIGLTALGTALFTFVTNTDLGIQAAAKYEKALGIFEKALTKVSDAQKIVDDFNNSSVEKTPELIESTKGRIKARIEEARATLLQAKAEAQLAIEEAKKESVLDFLIGFERVQRRVNKVEGEAAEKISEINRLLNELTVSYLKLGSASEDELSKPVEKLGLIESLTQRISDLNEKRNKATDIGELILLTKKLNLLKEELRLLNALAKRKASDSPEPIEARSPKEDRTPDFGISLPENLPGISDRLDIPDELVENIKEKTSAISDAFSSLGVQIASSLNISNDALRGFVTTLLSNAPKIIQAIFKQAAAKKAAAELENQANLKVATGNVIVSATEAAKGLGPVGLAVLPVLIGGALALISSAFNKGGGGSSGGGVGAGVSGTSFEGQGSTAFNGNREIFGELTVRGNDLVYVFDQSRDKIAKG